MYSVETFVPDSSTAFRPPISPSMAPQAPPPPHLLHQTPPQVKDSASGEALLSRFTTLAQQQNHPTASTSALDESLVRVELMTQVPGKEGLTYNDFILAIKINATPMADLAPPKRKKYWA